MEYCHSCNISTFDDRNIFCLQCGGELSFEPINKLQNQPNYSNISLINQRKVRINSKEIIVALTFCVIPLMFLFFLNKKSVLNQKLF